ncbi:MAG TPA: caspase family protein [Bryobacteraceae bacterium]|nr:caspase family protein [Bryobacteraceae bacterium]
MKKLILLAIVAAFSLRAAETFALVIGISKYQKLPRDLWLQYPDMDAQAIGRHLASPRGGGIPADRMLILTDQQATTAAIRDAFRTFLKTRPGKDDTVYVLIAGHGTVDSSGAYILTWDSDPGNLAQTALPMAELHSTVEEALSKVGHVILLADVCRAASIAGTKTAELGDAVAEIGEAPGELLGLMAARPREVSFEGPEFGGGHGAFTWSVLQGLEGAADSDHDGFVTAGELIDFVTAEVPGLTRNKQHPRDFGNMENATKLSDLSKPGIDIR